MRVLQSIHPFREAEAPACPQPGGPPLAESDDPAISRGLFQPHPSACRKDPNRSDGHARRSGIRRRSNHVLIRWRSRIQRMKFAGAKNAPRKRRMPRSNSSASALIAMPAANAAATRCQCQSFTK
jgi:hypothetical protein